MSKRVNFRNLDKVRLANQTRYEHTSTTVDVLFSCSRRLSSLVEGLRAFFQDQLYLNNKASISQ